MDVVLIDRRKGSHVLRGAHAVPSVGASRPRRDDAWADVLCISNETCPVWYRESFHLDEASFLGHRDGASLFALGTTGTSKVNEKVQRSRNSNRTRPSQSHSRSPGTKTLARTARVRSNRVSLPAQGLAEKVLAHDVSPFLRMRG